MQRPTHSYRASAVSAAAAGAASAAPQPQPPLPAHARRASDLSRRVLDDRIRPPAIAEYEAALPGPSPAAASPSAAAQPPGDAADALEREDDEAAPFDDAGAVEGAPPFLRGHVLRLWRLKRDCLALVQRVVEAPGGVRDAFGFQGGAKGGARAAVELLVADLVGAGGAAVPSTERTVVALHDAAFESFNLWALMTGGAPVHCSEGGSSSAAAVAAAGMAAPPASPIASPSAAFLPDGSDLNTKVYELGLLYCIRVACGSLRFCPELVCWLFHQMRNSFRPPDPEALAEAPGVTGTAAGASATAEDQEASSFFHRTTVAPLYEIFKRAGRRTRPLPPRPALARALCCGGCCGVARRGKEEPVRNSERPNYDDLNELFWRPEALGWAYHCLDNGAASCFRASLPGVAKSFRERASWAALLLSFWRWFAFQAVLFHALYAVAWDIAAAGGVNLLGVAQLNFAAAAVDATGCFETLAVCHMLKCLVAAAHEIATRPGAPSLAALPPSPGCGGGGGSAPAHCSCAEPPAPKSSTVPVAAGQ